MTAGVLPEHLRGLGSAPSALPRGRRGWVQVKPLPTQDLRTWGAAQGGCAYT